MGGEGGACEYVLAWLLLRDWAVKWVKGRKEEGKGKGRRQGGR